MWCFDLVARTYGPRNQGMERGVIPLTITHNESLVKVLLPVSESELSQFRGFNSEERNVSPEVLFDNSHLVTSSFSCL